MPQGGVERAALQQVRVGRLQFPQHGLLRLFSGPCHVAFTQHAQQGRAAQPAALDAPPYVLKRDEARVRLKGGAVADGAIACRAEVGAQEQPLELAQQRQIGGGKNVAHG